MLERIYLLSSKRKRGAKSMFIFYLGHFLKGFVPHKFFEGRDWKVFVPPKHLTLGGLEFFFSPSQTFDFGGDWSFFPPKHLTLGGLESFFPPKLFVGGIEVFSGGSIGSLPIGFFLGVPLFFWDNAKVKLCIFFQR